MFVFVFRIQAEKKPCCNSWGRRMSWSSDSRVNWWDSHTNKLHKMRYRKKAALSLIPRQIQTVYTVTCTSRLCDSKRYWTLMPGKFWKSGWQSYAEFAFFWVSIGVINRASMNVCRITFDSLKLSPLFFKYMQNNSGWGLQHHFALKHTRPELGKQDCFWKCYRGKKGSVFFVFMCKQYTLYYQNIVFSIMQYYED